MATKDGTKIRRHYGGRTAEERAGQRRSRLLDAALELYGTQGYASTSIEQICSAASISTRSFYEEMGSRENLLIALADDITDRAATGAIATLEQHRNLPVAERLARGFRAYLEVTCRNARTARVCYVEVVGVSDTVERWRTQWRGRIGTLVLAAADRAVARGDARPRDYRLFTIAVIGAVTSLAQELARADRDSRPMVSLDDICEEITALINAGIS